MLKDSRRMSKNIHNKENLAVVLLGDFSTPFIKLKEVYYKKISLAGLMLILLAVILLILKGSKSSCIDHIIYNKAMIPHVHLSSVCSFANDISDLKIKNCYFFEKFSKNTFITKSAVRITTVNPHQYTFTNSTVPNTEPISNIFMDDLHEKYNKLISHSRLRYKLKNNDIIELEICIKTGNKIFKGYVNNQCVCSVKFNLDVTNDSDLFDIDDNPNSNNNNKNSIINKINKSYGNTSKSVFDTFINNQTDIKILDRKQIKDNNAIQTAYQIMQKLKTSLNILEQKIKILKINNNDYVQEYQ
ncbi:hypothetical protein H8356DRAFT_1429199 [Neocallimastix lanati (nom. inval.)]|nr:hypothetical protein H8356DRAFT_1429199 [Neocallimastix sp. JGI-2020a]